MITTLFAVNMLLALVAGTLFLLFAFWIRKHHKITFPLWVAASVVSIAVLNAISTRAIISPIFVLTDLKGFSTEDAVYRLNILQNISLFLRSVGTVLLCLVGISEVISLIDKTEKRAIGFWSAVCYTPIRNRRLGLGSICISAFSVLTPLVYFKLIA